MKNGFGGALSGRIIAALLLACLGGCGGGETAASTDSGGSGGSGGGAGGSGGAGGGGAAEGYSLRVDVALTDDGEGVSIYAQNGAVVHVPPADLIGKTVWWATTHGGEPVSATTPIGFGSAVMQQDLTAQLETPADYSDGPWELSLFISVAGQDPSKGPQVGDLGAFDNSAPPAGQPPVTGSSVRMTVDGADAHVTMDNEYFVQF